MVALVLTVLWLRSYWRIDVVHCPTTRELIANSAFGVIQLNFVPDDMRTGWGPGWGWQSFPPGADAADYRDKAAWQWWTGQGTTVISFPVWPWVVVFALAAASRWREWRFSLRALLITMTLVAVALGVAFGMRS